LFTAMARLGSTLSQIVRNGWDGLDLEALTKHEPVRATDPHTSIAGDITADELRRFLGRLELVNGFANRFLFVLTTRSKHLPEGGRLTEAELKELTMELSKALEAAREIGRVERDPEAGKLWAEMYSELSADRPGLLGAATSRAAAQVLRLSLIYARSLTAAASCARFTSGPRVRFGGTARIRPAFSSVTLSMPSWRDF
jgi:hypothetical protein